MPNMHEAGRLAPDQLPTSERVRYDNGILHRNKDTILPSGASPTDADSDPELEELNACPQCLYPRSRSAASLYCLGWPDRRGAGLRSKTEASPVDAGSTCGSQGGLPDRDAPSDARPSSETRTREDRP